ncbi:MAG: hypothetical protein O3A46_15755 [Candidatus Poribacteria bacterium]|nr:hypothetical protein [Candidatus Poribacteria bacterium]
MANRRDRESPPAMPRWVKLFGIVVLILLVVFVIAHLAGGGLGNHLPSGSDG